MKLQFMDVPNSKQISAKVKLKVVLNGIFASATKSCAILTTRLYHLMVRQLKTSLKQLNRTKFRNLMKAKIGSLANRVILILVLQKCQETQVMHRFSTKL